MELSFSTEILLPFTSSVLHCCAGATTSLTTHFFLHDSRLHFFLLSFLSPPSSPPRILLLPFVPWRGCFCVDRQPFRTRSD